MRVSIMTIDIYQPALEVTCPRHPWTQMGSTHPPLSIHPASRALRARRQNLGWTLPSAKASREQTTALPLVAQRGGRQPPADRRAARFAVPASPVLNRSWRQRDALPSFACRARQLRVSSRKNRGCEGLVRLRRLWPLFRIRANAAVRKTRGELGRKRKQMENHPRQDRWRTHATRRDPMRHTRAKGTRLSR